MKLEQLPPETHLQYLESRLQQLEQLHLELQQTTSKLPAGRLRISQKSNRVEYYHVKTNKNKLGTYIPNKKLKLANQLAQKNYNIRLIKLIMPVTLPDAQYIEKWLDIEWQDRPFAEDAHEHFTANGERVRSKSEVQIADALNSYGIPYRYEFPLKLKNGITVYPDFLCLNVQTRQEFYWEHFGKMDDPTYADNATQKLIQYSENDLKPMRNLIITMETLTHQLNRHYIENQIKNYLIN